MPRAWFCRGSEDFNVAGPIAPGDPYRPAAAVWTFWDAETGGNRYTGLLLAGTTPVDSITVPHTGQPPAFQGPDTDPMVVAMWVQAGESTTRRMIDAGADIAVQAAADREAVAADRAAVEAVGTTNDTIIAGRINDPASATAGALSASYVQKPTADLGDWTLLRRDTSDVTKGVAWTTPSTVVARALGWVIVTDYATPQDAIDDAVTLGRTTAYVPAGHHVLTDALIGVSGLWLKGAGKDATFIECGTSIPSGGAGIGHRLIDMAGLTDWQITHLTLDMSAMTVFTSGVRCIHAADASQYAVQFCGFKTPGAAVASIGSSYYSITDNHAEAISSDGVAHHDGVIDQWGGCHHFEVLRNTIEGNGIAKYPILVTGEDTAAVAAACHHFDIDKNRIYNARWVGIWVNGREGVNTDFKVTGNTVDGVTDYFGIAVSDVRRFTVIGNHTLNTGSNGIRAYQETAGGAGGITGAQDGIIAHNIVHNANVLLSAASDTGAAICINDISGGIVEGPNVVTGTTHTYAVHFSTTAALTSKHVDGVLAAGTLGTVNNNPAGGSYTPTVTAVANVATVTASAAIWSRDGDLVTVRGRMTITPTAGANTTTQASISLPVASNLASASTDLFGTAATQFGTVAAISADTTNDWAQVQFPAPGTAAYIFYYSFTYKVL
ncbi:right-handed parallel beta-helix repeat-containing protein [Nocardioides sp. T2.26MG-1]|uniref:right-handed parallel beta-helix repeat-containing protein n=1 Tax=Nocardioides sp. T2.26MG-1 TaxID=3041166 RepID=UPI002477BC3E|nr:right-handed parallel beta-helix repeat-containing protein [Nocardioides sp. T2.26MG-1]CAI9417443.1 hypothetical protein HIDPHFAB_03021 [Nocardioides sp. T2.26MG-1]